MCVIDTFHSVSSKSFKCMSTTQLQENLEAQCSTFYRPFYSKNYLSETPQCLNSDANIPPSFHPATSSYTMYIFMCLVSIGSTQAGRRSSERVRKPKRQLTWTHQYTLGSTWRTCLASCSDVYTPIQSFIVSNSPFLVIHVFVCGTHLSEIFILWRLVSSSSSLTNSSIVHWD